MSRQDAVSTLRLLKEGAPLQLLLLRHAKSDWSAKTGDHERPLSSRGKSAAPRVGAFLHTKAYDPALVLCSTAERAKQTLALILPFLAEGPEIRYDPALYLARWPELLAEIQGLSGSTSPLLLVGHNPGLEQLAIAFAREPQSTLEQRRLRKLRRKFPTAAFAALDFVLNAWQAVTPGSATLADFVRPRDLCDGYGESHE